MLIDYGKCLVSTKLKEKWRLSVKWQTFYINCGKIKVRGTKSNLGFWKKGCIMKWWNATVGYKSKKRMCNEWLIFRYWSISFRICTGVGFKSVCLGTISMFISTKFDPQSSEGIWRCFLTRRRYGPLMLILFFVTCQNYIFSRMKFVHVF